MGKLADPLREYADELSERAGYGVTLPNPNVHSGAPIGPTDETCKLYEIADQIDAKHASRMEQCRRETKRATLHYIRLCANDYERGIKRVRKQ